MAKQEVIAQALLQVGHDLIVCRGALNCRIDTAAILALVRKTWWTSYLLRTIVNASTTLAVKALDHAWTAAVLIQLDKSLAC